MAKFTTIQVKTSTVKLLEEMKQHPRQGMAEVVETLVKNWIEQQK